jgi:hypothetical protein
MGGDGFYSAVSNLLYRRFPNRQGVDILKRPAMADASRVWKPAIQPTWKSALRGLAIPVGTKFKSAFALRSKLNWSCLYLSFIGRPVGSATFRVARRLIP